MIKTHDLCTLGAVEIASGIEQGRFSAEAVARSCLDRIAARDPEVQAWLALDDDFVLRQARSVDHGSSHSGMLRGVPFGVKDVIETADLPTQMGSGLYEGYRPRFDAACVALTRQAGGVLMGKTATAELAGVAPAATRNPLDLTRTPGGSSSGSGAAVADFMVPMAFGTQTGGSVLRPAAFCGVVGFKPTFGSYNPAGMKTAAVSFDTLGIIVRSVADARLIHHVLVNDDMRPQHAEWQPRIGISRTHLWDLADTDAQFAVEDAANRLAQCGATISEPVLPAGFASLGVHRATVNAYERARGLAAEWAHGRDALSQQMQQTCKNGFAIKREHYVAALRAIEQQRLAIDELLTNVDVLLTPSARGVAPRGLVSTGDPCFQELWTLLHVPAMTLPTHKGVDGLPIGIQLIGRRFDEDRLLSVAQWVMDALGRLGGVASAP